MGVRVCGCAGMLMCQYIGASAANRRTIALKQSAKQVPDRKRGSKREREGEEGERRERENGDSAIVVL